MDMVNKKKAARAGQLFSLSVWNRNGAGGGNQSDSMAGNSRTLFLSGSWHFWQRSGSGFCRLRGIIMPWISGYFQFMRVW